MHHSCFESFLLVLLVVLSGCTHQLHSISNADTYQQANRLEQADAHFEAGRFGLALRLYETFLNGNSKEVPYERLQWTYLALGLTTEARALEMRRHPTIAMEPWPGSWHCDMGMIAIQAGELEALTAHTNSLSLIVATLDPHPDPRALECLAFHEVFAYRFAAAQVHLERLAEIKDSSNPPPNLAFLYLRQERFEQADRILSEAESRAIEAASADPDDPEPHFELAEFAAMRGDTQTAVAAFSEAMDRGLGRAWWIYQLFDPESIPDPIFEPLYGNPDFERMRATVVEERKRMLPDSEANSR